jgi:hypothetical protein
MGGLKPVAGWKIWQAERLSLIRYAEVFTGLSESLNEYFPYFHQLAAVEPFHCGTERDPAECGQSVG